MNAILKNLAEATEAINLTVRENRTVIHDTLENVNHITLNGGPELAEDPRQRPRHHRGREGAARRAGRQDGQSRRAPRDRRAHQPREQEPRERARHIDSVAGRVDRGEGTIGRLTKDEALINEVQGVAEGVNDYVDGLRRLQTIVGLRSDYNFLANTIKSYVELRLQPREDKYYVIELINDPRGKTSFTQTDIDTTNPNEPAHYRTVTTTTTDAFRFTIQFARRIGPFTGRFGIKESTGGVGLDTHLLLEPLRDRAGPLRLRRGDPAALPRSTSATSSSTASGCSAASITSSCRTAATTSSACSSASPTTT